MEYRMQYPKTEGNWLYCPCGKCNQFGRYVQLPIGAEDWLECTPEERERMKEEYRIHMEEERKRMDAELGITDDMYAEHEENETL